MRCINLHTHTPTQLQRGAFAAVVVVTAQTPCWQWAEETLMQTQYISVATSSHHTPIRGLLSPSQGLCENIWSVISLETSQTWVLDIKRKMKKNKTNKWATSGALKPILITCCMTCIYKMLYFLFFFPLAKYVLFLSFSPSSLLCLAFFFLFFFNGYWLSLLVTRHLVCLHCIHTSHVKPQVIQHTAWSCMWPSLVSARLLSKLEEAKMTERKKNNSKLTKKNQ